MLRSSRSVLFRFLFPVIIAGFLPYDIGAENLTTLFLGNSHTYFNDLPGLVRQLAESGGDTLLTQSSTPGGCTLAYPPNAHLYNDNSLGLLELGGWDYVILQEQSQIPVIPYIRDNYMYPGAIMLDSLNHDATPCCLTILFMTWGWRDGGQHTIGGYSSPDFPDYHEMQDSVRATYLRLGYLLDAPVAPAGVAWQNAIRDGYPHSLFNADGYHPSPSGSYLAACVFYAVLFQQSPVGLSFTGDLAEENAVWLQAIADSTVFLHLGDWNIDPQMPLDAFEFELSWSPAVENHTFTYREAIQVRHPENSIPEKTELDTSVLALNPYGPKREGARLIPICN